MVKHERSPETISEQAQGIIADAISRGYKYASYSTGTRPVMYFLIGAHVEGFLHASIDEDFVLADLISCLQQGGKISYLD